MASLNGNKVLGVGVEQVTRKGLDKEVRNALVVLLERSNRRKESKALAECLKGSKALEEVLDSYTAKTFTFEQALLKAEEFSKQFGVPVLNKEAEALKQWRAEIARKEAEAKTKSDNQVEGEGEGEGDASQKEAKHQPKRKTLTEKLSAVLNTEEGLFVKIEALLSCLEVLNKEAAGAARLVMAGAAVKAAEATVAKAKAEAKEARKRAELARK